MELEAADKLERRIGSTRGVVMYVEDHDDSRLATCTLLTAAGFEVHEAATGEGAIAQAGALSTKLDVLIVDYNLGGEMTGTDVAERLARLLGYAAPTILLTGDPANAEVPLLRNCPVWVAKKPISTLTLIAGLHPFVSFRRAMQRIKEP